MSLLAPKNEMWATFHALADAAEDATLPHFRTPVETVDKGSGRDGRSFDPVTLADREAERAMRALITEQFPDDGIIGEEFAPCDAGGERTWFLDPIDGTRAFLTGLPSWGTLIGLMEGGHARAGMMAQPYTGERFWGDGRSARHRDRRGERELRCRACASLKEATLLTTSPLLFEPGERTAYDQVERRARIVRYGYDCYGYCMVALGCADLVIEAGLRPHDIMALVPIIEGAGGIVTDWAGGSPLDGGRIAAAGDRRLHAEALRLLAQG